MAQQGRIAAAARSYSDFAIARPWTVLIIAALITAIASWAAKDLKVNSKLEDLFPDDTPAVVAAQQARATLPSINKMLIVFGSPDKEANRKAATAFCKRAEKLPEIASVECQRDIDFFRRNAALWLAKDELLKIEKEVKAKVREATRKEMLGGEFGDDDGGDDDDDDEFADEKDEFADEKDEFADKKDKRPESPTRKVRSAPTQPKPAKLDDAHKPVDGPGDATTTANDAKGWKVPTDDEVQDKIGKFADLREWAENDAGDALGIKLFPKVDASDVEASDALVAKIDKLLAATNVRSFHPEMVYSVSGDYAKVSRHVATIRRGLYVTTLLAIGGIILLQLIAFRRFRALLLLFIPLLSGVALTTGFAATAIGYVNIITAFIFAILFGLGNDFAVYTLSHYVQRRAVGDDPDAAVRHAMPHLWGALGTAAATTAGSFLVLTMFDFRGFSQFGLIAGVGVLVTLLATLLLFPPLVIVLHRIWPEKAVSGARADGLKMIGVLANRNVARVATVVVIGLALGGGYLAQNLDFNTDFRRLRTVSKKQGSKKKESEKKESKKKKNDLKKVAKQAPVAKPSADEQRKRRASKLAGHYRRSTSQSLRTPILVVADTMADAGVIHRQLKADKDKNTRITHWMSIHTFVPEQQAENAAIARRIADHIDAKRAMLRGEDATEADRALKRLDVKTFTANDLPDFVRKRFLDVDGNVGRYLLMYPNGNTASARAVKEVMDQVGTFKVGEKTYRSTAGFFMLAEADGVVRREGPWAILAAAIAVLLITLLHFRNIRPVLFAFIPLVLGFSAFLGIAYLAELELNLFSVTVLPSVFGIGIDGTVHLVHRGWGVRSRRELAVGLQQVFSAAWLAALTTVVGFGALLFQDNRGVQTLAEMAVWGVATVCILANVLAGALLALQPGLDDDGDESPTTEGR